MLKIKNANPKPRLAFIEAEAHQEDLERAIKGDLEDEVDEHKVGKHEHELGKDNVDNDSDEKASRTRIGARS